MNILVNELGFFILDDKRKFKISKMFLELNLSDYEKEIYKIISKYCMEKEIYIINENDFNYILEQNEINFDRNIINALIQLQKNKYIRVEI